MNPDGRNVTPMNPLVAIIGTADDEKSVEYLNNALHARDLKTEVCPAMQPREILRWAMDLSPGIYRLCIFADTDGRLTASIATALDPAITALAWCPAPPSPERLTMILADTAALVCFAHDPTVIAGLAANLCQGVGASAAAPIDAPRSATIRNIEKPVSADKTAPPGPATEDSEADRELYKQLEAMMALPLKDRPGKPEPVKVQTAGLDFSLPLRHLMSAGSRMAHQGSHTEILGAHYLAALDEPYASAFSKAGFDPAVAKDYLAGLDSGEDTAVESVVSDEVFQAVTEGKRLAREAGGACVRVIDFLHGLLNQEGGSVADILQDADVTRDDLLQALEPLDTVKESASESFFQPSSYDQASFYQFNPTEVKEIENRLRDLPGFKKAAARVAEARTKQEIPEGGKAAAPSPVGAASTVAPVDPPDKPEFLKVRGEFPDVDVVEHVADRLLEGHVVAFPADIMHAVAVDATNRAAVAQLRQSAKLADDKPISILINSTSQLKHLARADVDALEPLFDELWPGPLTLVFQSAGAAGRHVATNGTIAVRQPADNLSLAILSMLGRPLAVTSWDHAKDDLVGRVAVVVAGDAAPVDARTTIVDMTATPWQVLREGAVPGQAVLSYFKK